LALFALLIATNIVAQANLGQVTPSAYDGFLCVSVELSRLFSPKTIATIQSGLPAIVDFEFRVNTSEQRVIAKKILSRRVTHDVWKGTYQLSGESTRYFFSSLDSVESACGGLKQVPLISLKNLKTGIHYTIQVRAQITPISRLQNQKLKDWLSNPDQTVEDIPGKDQSGGFSFNFSKLISIFVGSNERKENTTPWFRSRIFSLDEF